MTKLIAAEHTALTVMSETDLVNDENIIRKGKDAFIEVGNALIRIRDGRGYTFRKFKTFEEYCEKVWGFSDRHARRLMSGAETSETVKAITGETPANEAVAREFSKIASDPKIVERVASRLKLSGGVGRATAEKVATVIAQVKQKDTGDNSKPKAKEPPKPALPPTFTDECPHHRGVPLSYKYKSDSGGWQCAQCGGAVYLGVVSATASPNCQVCEKPLAPNATYCGNCGSPL